MTKPIAKTKASQPAPRSTPAKIESLLSGIDLKVPETPPRTAGTKRDRQKPRFDLLSPIALAYVARVLTLGADKYSAHNWREGISCDRLNAAILRHAMPMLVGEYCDRETGLPHAAHLMCEAMFYLELGSSDRFIPPSFRYTEDQTDLLAALLAGN